MKNKNSEYEDMLIIKNNALNTIAQQIVLDGTLKPAEKVIGLSQLFNNQYVKNLSTIIKDAYNHSPIDFENISEDWLMDFFSKAKTICDEEFQKIWSNVLKSESEKPGSVSKKLLQQLYVMDSTDALNFTNFSKFCFGDSRYKDLYHPILFLKESFSDYCLFGMNDKVLSSLQELNLIHIDYNNPLYYRRKKVLYYKDKYVVVTSSKNISAGNVKLTSIGQCLINQIPRAHSDVIFNYTVERWLYEGNIVQVNNKIINC